MCVCVAVCECVGVGGADLVTQNVTGSDLAWGHFEPVPRDFPSPEVSFQTDEPKPRALCNGAWTQP